MLRLPLIQGNTVTANFSDVAVQGQSILILCFSIIFCFSAIRMQDQQVFHQFKPGAVLYCFHGRNTSQSAGMWVISDSCWVCVILWWKLFLNKPAFYDLHAMAFNCQFQIWIILFLKVSTGWPDHCCWTSHFAAISFFQELLLKSHLLHAYYLEFYRSGWIVLIKSEILIMTGMVWPVSSDKWKAPKLWSMREVLRAQKKY